MSRVPTGALWVWRLQHLGDLALAFLALLGVPFLMIAAIFAPRAVTQLFKAGADWAGSRVAAMDEHRKKLDKLYSQESSE